MLNTRIQDPDPLRKLVTLFSVLGQEDDGEFRLHLNDGSTDIIGSLNVDGDNLTMAFTVNDDSNLVASLTVATQLRPGANAIIEQMSMHADQIAPGERASFPIVANFILEQVERLK